MKKASETIMAKRLLITRTHGFMIRPFFRLRARDYAFYSVPFAIILFLLAVGGFWFALGLVIAFLMGMLFVYIRWLQGMRRSWPFLSEVMNWEKIERISENGPLT
ncbi:MAG TPA: hypothetical protein VHB20_03110 [Verrucomicrobiae bacterium]|jgi:hypothetical protein|nr:hypothetical protein [Verrucomicrobiae bacterium]